jgi:hypothetical protein
VELQAERNERATVLAGWGWEIVPLDQTALLIQVFISLKTTSTPEASGTEEREATTLPLNILQMMGDLHGGQRKMEMTS